MTDDEKKALESLLAYTAYNTIEERAIRAALADVDRGERALAWLATKCASMKAWRHDLKAWEKRELEEITAILDGWRPREGTTT